MKMKQFRSAFTMIELIFVIVILGILASIALPKMGGTIEQAQIAKAQGDVSAIRAAIAGARQRILVRGINVYPTKLDQQAAVANNGQPLFDTNGSISILTYPLYASSASGEWQKTANNTYVFTVDTTAVTFAYNNANGIFDCNHNAADADEQRYCRAITE
jgi:general secretion pathway protein G